MADEKPFRITVPVSAEGKPPMFYYEEMRRQLGIIHATSGGAVEAFNSGDMELLHVNVDLMVVAVIAFGTAAGKFSKATG